MSAKKRLPTHLMNQLLIISDLLLVLQSCNYSWRTSMQKSYYKRLITHALGSHF